HHAQARMVIEKRLKGLSAVRFGAEQFYSKEVTDFTSYDSLTYRNKVVDNLTAGFAETDIYFTRNLAGKIGARVEYADLIDEWNLAPRISLAYQFDVGQQVSFATGTFYQKTVLEFVPRQTTGIGNAIADHYMCHIHLR